MKSCPNCSSKKISINEKSEFYCKKCGYINSKLKKACFNDFVNVFDKGNVNNLN